MKYRHNTIELVVTVGSELKSHRSREAPDGSPQLNDVENMSRPDFIASNSCPLDLRQDSIGSYMVMNSRVDFDVPSKPFIVDEDVISTRSE